jgi:hypothetical protein
MAKFRPCYWSRVTKDSVTDNFSKKNFRDPTSLAFGIAPVFESLRKARRRFPSLAHEKSRLLPTFLCASEGIRTLGLFRDREAL